MLRIRKIPVILFLLLAAISCIRPFDPDIESNEVSKYVITGNVTDQEGYQVVNVSMSSPVENPAYVPLSGCQVSIFDGSDREFVTEETEPGEYSVWMNTEDLVPGNSYRVRVSTPAGDILESDPDTLASSPQVEDIYFILEEHPTSNPAAPDQGIQFYVDLAGDDSQSRYYRWEIDETWEYHAAHAKEFYYDGSWHQINPTDSSTYVCYASNIVPDIFTLTTRNLAQNAYKQFPLHFVDGKSPRLGILYSVMIRQYGLSEAAYLYWDQLRDNSYSQGSLYEHQPLDIKGNVHVTSGNAQEVLGYFFAASVSSKRIFVQNVQGLVLDFPIYCSEDGLGHFGWREFTIKDYPVYYYYLPNGSLRILTHECVECELLGGTLVKPDFWPY